MKKPLIYIISLVILLMGLAACGSEEPTPFPPTAVSEEAEVIAEPTAEPTETPTAEPTIAPTVEPTAVPTEEPIAEEETAVSDGLTAAQISLDTDALGVEWFATLVPAGSYDASKPPGPKGLPEHVVVTFDNDDPATRVFGDPVMYIIPVNAYEELWNEAGNESVSSMMDSIEQMVTTLPTPAPTSGMPMLPYEELVGVNDIAAQVGRVASNDDSASKDGYRFVGRVGQGPNPVTNWQLRYIYQGFSNDGQYLVSFFYPVRTDALPDEIGTTMMDEFEADMTGHMNDSIAMLNELETSDWEPDLAVLDAVIASLQIEGMDTTTPESTDEPIAEEETADIGLTTAQISLDTDALGVEWFATLAPATAYNAGQSPGPLGLPEHVIITFGTDDPASRGFGDPVMYIIPIDAYKALWEDAGSDSVSNMMDSIEQMITTLPYPFPTSGMPVLPYEEIGGFNDVAAQVGRAASDDDSASKSGYRFVGRFGQSPNPVTNQNLRYIYQGFSNDGQYLVSFFYPVRTDALPDTPDATTMDAFEADMTGHMDDSIAMLNELETSDWEPDLAAFDEVVASLQIENMPSSGLIGSEWQWVRSERTETTEVDSPADYTLIFNNDGSYTFQADCNSGSGEFTVDGGFFGSMRMEAGISTLAECGESSRSNDMYSLMTAVQSYKLVAGGNELKLVWPAGGGNEIFEKAGNIEMTEPTDSDATESTDEALPTTLPAEITDVTWGWISFTDPVSGSQPIDEPERYQLTLNDNGSVNMQADCNSGSGSYIVEGNSISFTLGAMTKAACPPDSLADEFIMALGATAIYFTQEGDLFFDLIYDSGTMRLTTMEETAVSDTTTDDESDDTEAATEGNQITPESIHMDTQGLASSWTWQVVGGSAANEGPGGAPATSSYIMLTFDEMDAETAVAEGGPRLYIFPVESYIAAGGDRVENEVLRLQVLIDEANGRSELPIDPMPLLPPPSSFMGRWAQFADLDFGEGTGVRYVSEAINRQGIGPWTNNGTAYYYEGLTEDGRFYISLVWPVRTDSLPDTTDDVSEETMAAATDSGESYDAYLIETQNMLNALPSSAWEPSLADLDAMVESLQLYE